MNILITGIHGFVGSNLVAALKAQHTIYGLDIVSPQKEGVASTYGWNELKKIPTVNAIIHLAGKATTRGIRQQNRNISSSGTEPDSYRVQSPPASPKDSFWRE